MATRPRIFRPPGQPARAEANRAYDARRRQESDTRRLYSTARWRGVRRAQLTAEPLCRKCLEAKRLTAATVCDHVEPHRGDVDKFWAGPFQSLCTPCHSGDKQAEERAPWMPSAAP